MDQRSSGGMSFSMGAPREIGFALTVRVLLSAAAPKQSVWIDANRCRVAGLDFDLAQGAGPRAISGSIPADCVDADGKIVLASTPIGCEARRRSGSTTIRAD